MARPEAFQFPLHKMKPTKSFLFLVKRAFVLNTPGNLRAIEVHIRKEMDMVMPRNTNLQCRSDCAGVGGARGRRPKLEPIFARRVFFSTVLDSAKILLLFGIVV